MSIRPRVLPLIAGAALAVGAACAQSDPVGGGQGEDGDFRFGEGGSGGEYATEAGPETGVGGFLGTGGFLEDGEDGDPSVGGGGSTPGTGTGATTASSTSTGGGEDCGDGVCQAGVEGCDTCPEDCGGPCAGVCGDATCDEGEDCLSCPGDCGACAECGDLVCDEPDEDCDSCAEDCGVCPCMPDDFELNNSSGAATPIAIGTEYPDLSICTGDVDWLEFDVNGTRTITIRFSQAEGDLDLEIFSGTTAQYVTGSYSHDDDEQVVLSGQPSGPYWARVYGYQMANENPDYSIEVE